MTATTLRATRHYIWRPHYQRRPKANEGLVWNKPFPSAFAAYRHMEQVNENNEAQRKPEWRGCLVDTGRYLSRFKPIDITNHEADLCL